MSVLSAQADNSEHRRGCQACRSDVAKNRNRRLHLGRLASPANSCGVADLVLERYLFADLRVDRQISGIVDSDLPSAQHAIPSELEGEQPAIAFLPDVD